MHFEISKPIKWLGFCVVALVLGLLAVLYIDTNSELDIAGTIQENVVKKKTVTVEDKDASVATQTDVPSDWKTYTDATYGVSFKYPKDWPDATSELIKKYPDSPSNLDYQQVTFGSGKDSKYIIRSVQISKFADYEGTPHASSAQKIKAVYTSKSAKGTEKLWLPPSNAAIMSTNTPQYIETTDKSYRGIYYFANIGQDRGTALDCMSILTDGQEKIIQFHLAMASDKAAEYEKTITTDEGFSNFTRYVSSLDANSTETIVKEFNSIYKLMAQSVTKTDETASWKTYENKGYGFSLKYPTNWQVSPGSETGIVNLKSPETIAQLNEIRTNNLAVGGPANDIIITYYDNISTADSNNPKKYTKFSDMVNDTAYFSGVKQTQLANQLAYEATESGMLRWYTMLLERDNHIYKITLGKRENKSEISTAEQQILSTFQFTR